MIHYKSYQIGLRPLVYKYDLEDKVMEFDKSFARKNILKALQELLPSDEMISRSRRSIKRKDSISWANTLPNQFIHN